MKKLFVMLIVAAVLIAAGPQAQAAEPTEVKIGVLVALSGPAAPWGIPNLQGIELGGDEVNNRGGFKVKGKAYKWKIISYDHKYVPAEAVKAANKAIYSDKAKFLAIQGGSTTLACIPLMKENNILSLDFAGGGKKVTNPDNPMVFRYNPSIDIMYVSGLLYLTKNEGVKTMATINPDDATGHSGLAAAKRGAAYTNVKIITEEFFERGSKDFTSLLTRIIAKKPDMIETSYTDPTSSALICKQAREQGYEGVILLSWGPNPTQVLKIAGPHAEKAYMFVGGPIEPQTDYQKKIYNDFVKKWGAKNWDNGLWSNVGLLPCLAKGIEAAQSFEPEAIAKKLENIEWDTPTGKLSFGGSKLFGIKRQLLYKGTLYQFRKGLPIFLGILDSPPDALD